MFTRLVTAHNDSERGSNDGDTTAGSSCEREQPTGDAYEKKFAGIGLSKRFRSFETTSKILNIPMKVKKIRANMTAWSKHSICRSTAECTVRITWTVEQELSSELL